MPSFKHKTSKKLACCKKATTTIDSKHTEFVNQFAKEEQEIIPELKNERRRLRQLLDTTLSIEGKMEISDRIKDITENIRQIKQNKNRYYLNNSKYIFEYFENKKHIDNVEEPNKPVINAKNQLLFNMFKIKQQEEPKPAAAGTGNDFNKLIQKYLSNVDETFLDMNAFVHEIDICQNCHKGEMTPIDDEGVLICNSCAVNIPYLIENEKQSYKEPPKEVCFYAYKKINHFKEILAQFQGKETTQIPDIVIEQIHQQIKKERIGLEQLTYHKTKEILKKLGFNKYYEHIAFIKNKLGIKPPVFSPELEDTLCNLFMETQTPYAKTCPNSRVNFLNYYYVLFKFCELIEETDYLHEIPLLKDREKLIEQDVTWKKMCVELNWEFIPTV
jgi:hypothetical protein